MQHPSQQFQKGEGEEGRCRSDSGEDHSMMSRDEFLISLEESEGNPNHEPVDQDDDYQPGEARRLSKTSSNNVH
jgi:hypothetical protein